MENTTPPAPRPFPAARVGAIAGISAALTLVALAALFLLGRWVLADIAAQDDLRAANEAAKAQEVVSPQFKSAIAAYVVSIEKEHAAAARGWKAFQAPKVDADAKETALESATKTRAELELQDEAYHTQFLYSSCVEAAIGPDHYKTLIECEKESPLDPLRDLAAKAGSK